MSVNSNGDYEALAKLLYPSIEASGNVYYGQTRKLAMDEVFDKYKGGFESHIESRRVEDASSEYGFKYEKYFCWSIGPLFGEFCIDGDGEHHIPMESYPLYYAKYLLNKTIVAEENVLNSGTYNSYHYDVEPKLKKVFYHDGKNPCDDSQWDGKSFYVINDGINDYLYVAVTNGNKDNMAYIGDYDENNPIKFTAVGDCELFIDYFNSSDGTDVEIPDPNPYINEIYEYVTETGETGNFEVGNNNYIVHISSDKSSEAYRNFGSWVKVWLSPTSIKLPEGHSGDVGIQFSFVNKLNPNRGSIKISGDIRSLQYDKSVVGAGEFCRLFSDLGERVLSAPSLPSKVIYDSGYKEMFLGCTNLTRVPPLPATDLATNCYKAMLQGCSSVNSLTLFPAENEQSDCYPLMLMNCNLQDLYCITLPSNIFSSNGTAKRIHTSINTELDVPDDCEVIRDFELEYTYDD